MHPSSSLRGEERRGGERRRGRIRLRHRRLRNWFGGLQNGPMRSCVRTREHPPNILPMSTIESKQHPIINAMVTWHSGEHLLLQSGQRYHLCFSLETPPTGQINALLLHDNRMHCGAAGIDHGQAFGCFTFDWCSRPSARCAERHKADLFGRGAFLRFHVIRWFYSAEIPIATDARRKRWWYWCLA